MNKTKIYWLVNAIFCSIVAIGVSTSTPLVVHPLYLVLLFALCTTPILNCQKLNDEYGLLVLFSAMYFHFFGTLDLVNLFTPHLDSTSIEGLIDKTEIFILLGGLVFHITYRILCKSSTKNRIDSNDLDEANLLKFGIPLWVITSSLDWNFKINIIPDYTSWGIDEALANSGIIMTSIYMTSFMLGPLSEMILFYVYIKYKHRYMLAFSLVIVLYHLILGFIADSKIETVTGMAILMMAIYFYEGTLPRRWMIFTLIFLATAYPTLMANRALRGTGVVSRQEVSQKFIESIKLAFVESKQSDAGEKRTENWYERTSLKGSVTTIVTRTGKDAPYQRGMTFIAPVLSAYIPRIIWPSKPTIEVGRLMNKEFQIAPRQEWVYISPSHLGELYWNFGFLGALFGMGLMGAFYGAIGKRIDMSRNATITKFMLAAASIKYLILGFESSIAVMYVVWMRTALAIWVFRIIMIRRSSTKATKNNSIEISRIENISHTNLMR